MPSSIKVNLINGPSIRGEDGSLRPSEDVQADQVKAFEEQLGVDNDTLGRKTKELDPEALAKLNHDFLHQSIAVGGLYDAFNSANRQNGGDGPEAPGQKGPAIMGASDIAQHGSRELSLISQEGAFAGAEVPVEA